MDEASGSVVESSVVEFAVDDGSQMRGVELAVKQLRPTERARLLIAASAPGATPRPAAKFFVRGTLTLSGMFAAVQVVQITARPQPTARCVWSWSC